MSGHGEVGDGIEIHETRDPRAPEVSEAVALGRAFRNTLGFLPAGVYEEAAMRGTLEVAVASGSVVGYALYGLTKRYGVATTRESSFDVETTTGLGRSGSSSASRRSPRSRDAAPYRRRSSIGGETTVSRTSSHGQPTTCSYEQA
jgi:hypothetical protein